MSTKIKFCVHTLSVSLWLETVRTAGCRQGRFEVAVIFSLELSKKEVVSKVHGELGVVLIFGLSPLPVELFAVGRVELEVAVVFDWN